MRLAARPWLEPAALAVGKAKASPERPRVLLVEDHADTAMLLRMALRKRGYDVETAGTMAAGEKTASEQVFDALISDIALPDGSGLELLRRVRARSPTPAIALSGFGTEVDVQRSREAGFAEHLVKPVDVATLDRAIRKLLETRTTA